MWPRGYKRVREVRVCFGFKFWMIIQRKRGDWWRVTGVIVVVVEVVVIVICLSGIRTWGHRGC